LLYRPIFIRPVETGGYDGTKSAFADCDSGIGARRVRSRGAYSRAIKIAATTAQSPPSRTAIQASVRAYRGRAMTNPSDRQELSGDEPKLRIEGAEPSSNPPPPDHEGFVEVRSIGLRAVRANLARRRKPR
jgi:hypothetical protein